MLKLKSVKKYWQLFIFLLVQQEHIYVCQDPVRKLPNTIYPTSSPMLVVTASEATLLTTMRKFPKLNTRKEPKNMEWDNSKSNEITTQKQQGYRIFSVHTHCTREMFEMQVNLNRPFRGLFYAKDFPLECRARGNNLMNITLRLPTSGCGIRSETLLPNGDLELSVKVMLQTEEKLRQSSDIMRTLSCQLPANAIGMNLDADKFIAKQSKHRSGRTRLRSTDTDSSSSNNVLKTIKKETSVGSSIERIANIEELPPTMKPINSKGTPRVRIWLELGGSDGSGTVEVGQATTLRVRAIVPETMGVRIVDCAALDGLGESSQQLLDDGGCPIDQQVMPALQEKSRHIDEGWSKRSKDDPVEKIFSATFPAFKFPDRERLHVSCGVQLCKGNCPNVACRLKEKFLIHVEQHLARIEVFNSLAVMAPQIENNRFKSDQRYNTSDFKDNSAYLHKISHEGILCLSLSKLALSFCVLGVIFLLAIIVSICSLIVSRRQSRRHYGSQDSSAGMLTSTDVYTSSSESVQSARLGSKLFMAYYSQTLPYGRVY